MNTINDKASNSKSSFSGFSTENLHFNTKFLKTALSFRAEKPSPPNLNNMATKKLVTSQASATQAPRSLRLFGSYVVQHQLEQAKLIIDDISYVIAEGAKGLDSYLTKRPRSRQQREDLTAKFSNTDPFLEKVWTKISGTDYDLYRKPQGTNLYLYYGAMAMLALPLIGSTIKIGARVVPSFLRKSRNLALRSEIGIKQFAETSILRASEGMENILAKGDRVFVRTFGLGDSIPFSLQTKFADGSLALHMAERGPKAQNVFFMKGGTEAAIRRVLHNDDHSFGVPINLDKFPYLKRFMQEAETIQPAPLLHKLDKGFSNETALVAYTNQFNFANATSSRFLGTSGDTSCRSYFFRIPKTENPLRKHKSAQSLVIHISATRAEDDFLCAFDRIARQSDSLDLYVMGGINGYSRETLKNYHPGITVQGVDHGLKVFFERARNLNVKINPRIVNLHNAKIEENAVLDNVTGEFFYVTDETMMPYHGTTNRAFSVLDNGNIRLPNGEIISPDAISNFLPS